MERFHKPMMQLLMLFIILLLVSLVVGIAMVYTQLENIFKFETEMYMCMEDAQEYLAPCHVERDNDSSYHWYLNPNEGRI